jgi:serine/threonine-protein kinase
MANSSADMTAALPLTAPRRGLGLTWKIFLATAAVVVLAIGGAIAWSSAKANQVIDQAARDAFRSTEFVFSNLQSARYDKLQRLSSLVAQDSVFRAVILETDEATQQDDLRLRQELLGADLVLATDADGRLLARTDGAGQSGDDLGRWPVVAQALEGESARSLMAQDGTLYHAVAIPIGRPGQDLAGVLLSGFALDRALADEMKGAASTEVAFLRLAGDAPQVVAATLGSDPPALAALAGQLLAAGASEPRRVEVGGITYLARLLPLATASGEMAGGLLALRSIATEQATFRRLRDSLLLIGLVAVLSAFLLSFLLARRITGPLRGLVRVAESVRDGDYEVAVPPPGQDEVGALADAIRAMVRELRDKAELERYVAELSAASGRAGDQTAAIGTAVPTQASQVPAAATTTAAAARLAEPRPGQLFAGRYEVLEVIGRGGMGKVYKVRDRELDEVVALKTIRKDVLGNDPEALERFKLEIKLARKATHKNIMRTFDFGDAEGVQYLTMEYVTGYTLRELVHRQGELPLGISLRIARQICTGLHAAHEAGIIHRDVKSQNILIQPNGDIKIMDFGIARPHGQSDLTSAGTVVGTPEFMAPEQALGKPVDFRADIYSAGIVFYELFSGQVPFRGQSAVDVAVKHVQETPPPIARARPDLPAGLAAVVMRMIEKEPARRFPSFAAVYQALMQVQLPARAA